MTVLPKGASYIDLGIKLLASRSLGHSCSYSFMITKTSSVITAFGARVEQGASAYDEVNMQSTVQGCDFITSTNVLVEGTSQRSGLL